MREIKPKIILATMQKLVGEKIKFEGIKVE